MNNHTSDGKTRYQLVPTTSRTYKSKHVNNERKPTKIITTTKNKCIYSNVTSYSLIKPPLQNNDLPGIYVLNAIYMRHERRVRNVNIPDIITKDTDLEFTTSWFIIVIFIFTSFKMECVHKIRQTTKILDFLQFLAVNLRYKILS